MGGTRGAQGRGAHVPRPERTRRAHLRAVGGADHEDAVGAARGGAVQLHEELRLHAAHGVPLVLRPHGQEGVHLVDEDDRRLPAGGDREEGADLTGVRGRGTHRGKRGGGGAEGEGRCPGNVRTPA